MPDMFNPPSVIPDVINRESMVFPCMPKQIKEQKNTGFPLTTGGNDRGGAGGNDKGARTGMTEGPGGQNRDAPGSLSPFGRGEG